MTKITVKEFFQGMESLYDENLATTFLVAEDLSQADTKAKRAWVRDHIRSWSIKVVQESGLLISQIEFGTDRHDLHHFMGKFTFVGSGALNENLEILPQMKEGFINVLKKNLARKVMEKFPIFPESSLSRHKIGFAAQVPVYFELEKFDYPGWGKKDLNVLKSQSLLEKVQNTLIPYHAEILDDIGILDSDYKKSPLSMRVIFNEIISEDRMKEIEESLTSCFTKSFKGLINVSVITLNDFPYYLL